MSLTGEGAAPKGWRQISQCQNFMEKPPIPLLRWRGGFLQWGILSQGGAPKITGTWDSLLDVCTSQIKST